MKNTIDKIRGRPEGGLVYAYPKLAMVGYNPLQKHTEKPSKQNKTQKNQEDPVNQEEWYGSSSDQMSKTWTVTYRREILTCWQAYEEMHSHDKSEACKCK